MKNKITARMVLKQVVIHYVEPMNWFPILYSARAVSSIFKISKYQAGKILRLLEAKGYIKYTHEVMCRGVDYESQMCDCDHHMPSWGYIPTEKGKAIFAQHIELVHKQFDDYWNETQTAHYGTRYNNPHLVTKK